jgi:hypothetical protein
MADEWLVDYNGYWSHEYLDDLLPDHFKPQVFNADVSTSGFST